MPFDVAGAKSAGYSDTEIADFLSEHLRFDALKAREAGYADKDIISYLSENEALITQGRAGSAGKSFMRAGGEGVGETTSFLGRINETLSRFFANSGEFADVNDPETAEVMRQEFKRWRELPAEKREKEIQQAPLYKAGRAITEGAREAFQPNPRFSGEFLTDVIPSSAGGMVPTVAAGLINPALAMAQYGGSAGEAAAEEAIEAGRPDLANRAAMITAPIGAITEGLLGAGPRLASRLVRGVPAREATSLGRRIVETSGRESLQEGLEQIGGNVTASTFAPYDPERGAFEGVPTAMAAGALLGAGAEGVIGGVDEAVRRMEESRGLRQAGDIGRLMADLNLQGASRIQVGGVGRPQSGVSEFATDFGRGPLQNIEAAPKAGLRRVKSGDVTSQLYEATMAGQLREASTASDRRIRPNQASRRAAVEAGLELESGQTVDLPEAPRRTAPSVENAYSGLLEAVQEEGPSPLDEAIMSGMLQRALNLPPEVSRVYDSAGEVSGSYLAGEDVDPAVLSELDRVTPQLLTQLQSRINTAIDRNVSDDQVSPLIDLHVRLSQYDVERKGEATFREGQRYEDWLSTFARWRPTDQERYTSWLERNASKRPAARLIRPAAKSRSRIAAAPAAQTQAAEPQQPAGPSAADLARGVLGRSGIAAPAWPQQPIEPQPNPSAMDLVRGVLSRSGFPDPAPSGAAPERAASASVPQQAAPQLAAAESLRPAASRRRVAAKPRPDSTTAPAKSAPAAQAAATASASPEAASPSTSANPPSDTSAALAAPDVEAERIADDLEKLDDEEAIAAAMTLPEEMYERVGGAIRARNNRAIRELNAKINANREENPFRPNIAAPKRTTTSSTPAPASAPQLAAPAQAQSPAQQQAPVVVAPPKKKTFKPKKAKSTLLSAEEEAEVEKALAGINALIKGGGQKLGVSGGGDAELIRQLSIIALQYIRASARKARRLFSDYASKVRGRLGSGVSIRDLILGWNVHAATAQGEGEPVGAVPEIGSIARIRAEGLNLATSPKNAKIYGVVLRYEEDGTAFVALTNMSAKATKAVGYRGGEVIQVPIDAVIDERVDYNPELESEDSKELEIEGEANARRGRVLAAAKEAERIPVYNTLLALSEKALFGASASEAEKPVEVTPYVREFIELTQRVVSPAAAKEDIAKWNADLAGYTPAQAWSIIGNVLGPTMRTAIEATYYIADSARFVEASSRRESAVSDAALEGYIDRVINWAHKNMFGAKGPVWTRFAPATALKNATLDAGRKQMRRRSRETSLEGEQLKFGDAVQSSAASDTASTGQMANESNDAGMPDQGPAEDPSIALFDVIAILDKIGGFDVGNEVDERLVANRRRADAAKRIRELVAEEVRLKERQLGRELEFTELKEAIAGTIRIMLPERGVTAALVESTTKSSESGLIELDDAISRASRKIAYALFNVYQDQGSDGIRYNDRLFSGPATLASDSTVALGEGSYSIADAVRIVSAKATKGSVAERVASRLLQLAGGGRVTVLSDSDWQRMGRTDGEYAYYDVNTGNIFVRQTAAAHDYLVMHEAVHALTVDRIKSDPEFRRFILGLRKEAIGRVPGNWYGLQEHGADWRNAAEFVGEALSSTAFQEELQKIPAGKKTIWQAIKDAIGKLVGLGGEDARTMLDVIMDAALVKGQSLEGGPTSSAGDSAYMALAERFKSGDESVLPELERMVERAAKAAGYNVGPVYHGTTRQRVTRISPSKGVEIPGAAFFTDNADMAAEYTLPREFGEAIYEDEDGNEIEPGVVASVYLKLSNPAYVDMQGDVGDTVVMSRAVEEAISTGRDGVVFRNVRDGLAESDNEGTSIAIFDGRNAKSADPVTYADDGSIIPLSQRFNPQSDSILFAAPTWGSRKQVREAVTGPGLTESQVDRIETLASIMAGVVSGRVNGVISSLPKKAKSRLAWISRIGKLADAEERQVGEVEGLEGDLIPEYDAVPGDEAAMGPQRIADLEQRVRELAAAGNAAAAEELTGILEEGSVSAANIVDRINRMRESQVVRLQKRMQEVERTREKVLEKIRKGERRADFISAAANDMVDQYEEYVDDLSQTKVGPDARADAVIADAAQKVRQTRSSMEEVEKALRAIVDNVPPGLVEQAAAAKSPQVIVDWVRASGVLASSGVKPSVVAQLLDGDGALLPRYASLHKMIETVKAYEAKAGSIEGDIAAFEKEWADIWANTKLWVYDSASRTWVKRKVTRKTEDGKEVEEEAPDPKAKRVDVEDWAKKYASMVAKLTRQMDAVRLLSREIAKQDADILTTIEVIRALDAIIADPELNQQYEGAVRVINLLGRDYRGRDLKGGGVVFRVGEKEFTVQNSMEKSANDEANATVQEIRAAIDKELETETDPFERNRLQKMLIRLTEFGQTMTDAALSIGFFDWLTRFRAWFPLTRTQITRDLTYRLLSSRLGGELRAIAQLVDSAVIALKAVRDHKSYGYMAMDLANARAVRSHPGMDPIVWNREVLNQLLAGNQELKRYNLKVGDVIPTFGHKITKEDMEAARLQAKFSDSVYRVMRGMGQSGIRMHFPVLVQDANGKLRYPYASGALTVPRRMESSGGPGTLLDLAGKWISIGSDFDGKVAKLAEVDFFRRFALAHVSELNPEYQRQELFSPVGREPYQRPSSREAAYQRLAVKWAQAKQAAPVDFDELVQQVSDEAGQSRSDVRSGLVREIDNLARNYILELEYRANIDMSSGKIDSAVGDEAAPNKIGRLIDPDNNFSQARGKMVAPSTFYDYTLSSDVGRGSLIAGATLQHRTRQLELLKVMIGAIDLEIARQKEAISKADKSGTGRQVRRGISADVAAGRLYADLSELDRLSELLNEANSNLKESMQKVSQAVAGKTLFEDFIDVQRTLLVGQFTAAMANFMSAISAGQWVPRAALSRLGGSLGKGSRASLLYRVPLSVIKTAAKAAFDVGTFALYKFKPARRWLLANRGKLISGLSQIAEAVKAMQDADENLRRLGVIPDQMKLRERARIISEIGTFSNPVPASESELPGFSEKIRRLFSKPLLAHGVEFLWSVPSSMDRLSNVINAVNAELAIKRALGNAAMIIANRAAAKGRNPDGSLYNADWADPANAFTEAEARAVGMSLTALIAMKQEFGVVGGLERLAHDYWRRIQEAKARGENPDDVPPIADPGIAGDLVIRMLAMTNLATDSNSPDVIKGNTVAGRIINSFIAFPRWINSWVSTLGLLQATAPTGGVSKRLLASALATMVTFAMLAVSGLWLNELKALAYKFWNDREYPVLTLSNVVNDPSPATAVRLLGAAIALNIPYAGEGIASLAGATQYRSSATDISSLSLPISMVNRVYDGVSSIMKTGDYAGGASQIVRALVPGSGAVINRMMPGRTEISDAQRSAIAARGPLEARESGGKGGQPTEFSSLVRRAVAAEIEGDRAGADRLIRRAVEVKSKDSDDPWGAVRSAVQASSPSIRAFGRRITDSEEQGLLGRMTGSQRRSYTTASGAVDSLLQRVGSAGRAARGATPTTAAGPAARLLRTPPTSVAISRIRAARAKAMPKALKEARAKLRQAKIRIPRVSGSGSGGRGLPRLIRPVRGQSALRPLRSPMGA